MYLAWSNIDILAYPQTWKTAGSVIDHGGATPRTRIILAIAGDDEDINWVPKQVLVQ